MTLKRTHYFPYTSLITGRKRYDFFPIYLNKKLFNNSEHTGFMGLMFSFGFFPS